MELIRLSIVGFPYHDLHLKATKTMKSFGLTLSGRPHQPDEPELFHVASSRLFLACGPILSCPRASVPAGSSKILEYKVGEYEERAPG